MKYTQLEVWQRAVEYAVEVYTATAMFPAAERFGLRLQMRKAAVSIPSNIAEGEGRRTRRDHARFLLQARGSIYELETQIVISARLRYFSDDIANQLVAKSRQVGQLVNGTLRYLRRAADREAPTANS